MPLEAGYRIRIAPRFAVAADWDDRLRRNSGVLADDGRCFPKPDWTHSPMRNLASWSPGRQSRLPTRWPCSDHRAIAVAVLGIDGEWRTRTDWFTGYARELTEFARFKGLPLPPRAFSVALTPAGQPSTRPDPTSPVPRLAGLTCSGPSTTPHILGTLEPERRACCPRLRQPIPQSPRRQRPRIPSALARLPPHPTHPEPRRGHLGSPPPA